ncbi:MAG: HAMP domain-containing sensor histidine kinase [Bacteroidota bacterium]
MIKYLKRLHSKLIGNANDTPIQARIYHEVSIIAMIGLPVALAVNFFISVPLANIAMTATWLLIAGLYLNSRYYGNLRSSVIIFTIGSSILISFNYFINSGVNGPTLLLFLLSLIFVISVMPGRQFMFWLPINLAIVGSLLLVEYEYPELVGITYSERSDLFLDMGTTYIGVIVCISVVLSYLIKNYQREKNNALQASVALKVANDSKTRLLSILSHDLRAPLNSIQSFLEVLMDYDLSQDERKFMEKNLLNETKNTQVMLHNLLNWSKSQMDGGTKVNLTDVNLQTAVTACLRVQEAAATEKNISITAVVDTDIEITADLDMLKLVIRNLINNAVKFTPTGGQIVIYSSADGRFAQLHVQDNGTGISAERQQSLFSLDGASTYGTSNEKGVGLGLMLCKEFTELQGGKISFSSIDGKGTTFTLKFPLT